MKTKVLIVTVEFFIVNCFSMKSERPSQRRACPNKWRAKKKQLFSIELGLQSHKIAEFSCNFSLLKDVFFFDKQKYFLPHNHVLISTKVDGGQKGESE